MLFPWRIHVPEAWRQEGQDSNGGRPSTICSLWDHPAYK